MTRLLPTAYCLLLTVCCLLMAGCAELTPIGRPTSFQHKPAASALEDGYDDYTGVLHIHTTYSHDAMGTFEEAVRVANAQRLDYIIITEHNTLQPLRDGKEGWHGATLVLIGVEISTRAGHYLSLNVTKEIDRTKLTTQEVIDEVNRQGGFGFIAHPYFKNGRWKDWTVTGFTGIEGYNVAHDTLEENKLRLALWTVSAPAEPFYLSILDRPYDPLAKWDELIRRHGRVVGIGSSDAHEFHLLGLTFAPYTIMFQLSRTHLLIQGPLNPEKVYEALRSGHAYFSIELLAEAKGFSFTANDGKRVLGIMGDEVPLQSNLQLTASLPAPAQLTLFRDGHEIDATTNQAWTVPVAQPGAYRLEASRHGKPWIFSNPIYVRQPTQAAPSPASPPSTEQPAAPQTRGNQSPEAGLVQPTPTTSPAGGPSQPAASAREPDGTRQATAVGGASPTHEQVAPTTPSRPDAGVTTAERPATEAQQSGTNADGTASPSQ